MELYCENSNQLTTIFQKHSIKDVRMYSEYVSQKTEIVKMKVN